MDTSPIERLANAAEKYLERCDENDIVALNHCANVLTDELIDLGKRVSSFCESLRNEGGDIFIGEKYIGWADTEGDAAGIVDEIKSGLAITIVKEKTNE